ncbi:MAG: hypothetical protein ABIR98_05160 [Usitatibacter sp.]
MRPGEDKLPGGRLRMVEVADAEPFAGELFRRVFHFPPPDFPRHFVALYETDSGAALTLGYIHFTPHKTVYLCGGMAFDERLYRRLPVADRKALRALGGVAHLMHERTRSELADGEAIFGYVGDVKAERVDLRSGFVHTGHKHLIVTWLRAHAPEHRAALVDEIRALGPF